MKLQLLALPFLLSTALLVGCQTPEATTPDAAEELEQPGNYPETYPEGADPSDAEGAETDPSAIDAPAGEPTTP